MIILSYEKETQHRVTRRAVLESLSVGTDAGMAREGELFHDIMRSDDAVEGATAFTEKRGPVTPEV